MAVNFKVIRKSRAKAIGEFCDARSVLVIGDDRKFIAAKPCDEDAISGCTQAIGDAAQQQIADGMSVNIIDLLKIIEVYAQYCETFALGLRRTQRRGQALIEGDSIWKIRQRIAMRHMRNAFLRLLTLRHIIEHG